MVSSLHHWCHSLHEWFVVQYLQIIYKYRLISLIFFLHYLSTSTNFCYNNQLSTILSNHIPSTLYNIYTLFSLNFLSSSIYNSQINPQFLYILEQFLSGMFFYLCYLCSSVSMCVLTFIYYSNLSSHIYLNHHDQSPQSRPSYMW
jgi:hypothetical protein